MNELGRLEDQLLAVEARIGLLDACRPIGLAGEEARLDALLAAASRPNPAELVPRLDWPARAPLEPELVRLEQVGSACARLGGDVARILGGRAEELALDAALVRARGTADIIQLARRRFVGAAPADRLEADRLARRWIAEPATVHEDAEQVDLADELRRLLSTSGLEVDVVEVEMAARAAVSNRALLARRGARVTRQQASRILAHEVFGHFLPRKAAWSSGTPFRIGPRGADADEEGRALELEVVGGHVDAERRLELSVRHVLSAQVLDGAHAGEALLDLRASGVPSRLLARTAPRVLRAGGLCREIIYLPGLLRVGPSLADPEVERVFRSGRATLEEAGVLGRLLSAAQPGQFKSAMTGV